MRPNCETAATDCSKLPELSMATQGRTSNIPVNSVEMLPEPSRRSDEFPRRDCARFARQA